MILGIGNPLRGDDAVGLKVIQNLSGRIPGNVLLLECGMTPENYLGKIEEFDLGVTGDYTTEGRLLGHMILGLEILETKLAALDLGSVPRPSASAWATGSLAFPPWPAD